MDLPVSVTAVVLLIAITLIAAIIWTLARAAAPDRRSSVPAGVGAILAGWLLVVSMLALHGGFGTTAGVPAVVYPLVLGVVGVLAACWTIQPLRDLIVRPPVEHGLIALHAWRVGGAVFVVLAALGYLPALFALPAGLGDLAVGLTAPFVARDRASAAGRRRAVLWIAFGLLDLLIAVGLGATASPGPVQVFDVTPSTVLLGEFPLVLFPAFLVPLTMALHILSLGQLLRSTPLAVAPSPQRA